MSTTDGTETRTGVSLARGPALILGTILLAAGLYFLYKEHTFVKFSQFPSGTAKPTGKVFFGIFGVNGWTGELTAVAGGLLLFGAAQHLVAKAMSLIVGVALGIVAVWALVNHHTALGLFGAGIWTIIGFGACAVLLLFNTVIPRRKTTVATAGGAAAGATAAGTGERRTRTIRRTPAGTGTTAATPGGTETESAGATRVRPGGERTDGEATDD